MDVFAIPKEVTKGEELVIIPRKLYERFRRALKIGRERLIFSNAGLREALNDVKSGRIIGPFSSLKEGLMTLKKAT